MDGFSRLNATGRLSGEWDIKQICNRGCWRTGKYIFLFTQPQMFIRRRCGERRRGEPAKTLKARQHASRISIHFNSFLSGSLLVRKSTRAAPWSKRSAIQPIAKEFRKLGSLLYSTVYSQGPSNDGPNSYEPSGISASTGGGFFCTASVANPGFQLIQSHAFRSII